MQAEIDVTLHGILFFIIYLSRNNFGRCTFAVFTKPRNAQTINLKKNIFRANKVRLQPKVCKFRLTLCVILFRIRFSQTEDGKRFAKCNQIHKIIMVANSLCNSVSFARTLRTRRNVCFLMSKTTIHKIIMEFNSFVCFSHLKSVMYILCIFIRFCFAYKASGKQTYKIHFKKIYNKKNNKI